ncbi:MAG: hypothetical protein K2X82_10045 [Gemmataceae bacterium]|nr:hypothetical protein [Gemmataceae bacterium]
MNSHEVRAGDVVYLRGGGPAVVRRVRRRDARTAVCNLTVGGLHTFAVGTAQALVHNTSGTTPAPYVLFNKTHAGSLPNPKGVGPNGGRLQSHHGLQQEWAAQNLPGYDPKLAPTVTIETGKGFPHTTLSTLQNARRDARVAAGLGKWSSTIDEELSYIVTDFRLAGFGDDVIRKVLEQNYKMLDKLGVQYTRPAGF